MGGQKSEKLPKWVLRWDPRGGFPCFYFRLLHLPEERRRDTWEPGRTRSSNVKRRDISKASHPLNGFAGAVSLWALCRIAELPFTHLSLVLLSLFIQPEFEWSRLPTAF